MPSQDIAKTTARRKLDMFEAMRDEMNRMFERFDRGWPSLPAAFPRGFGRDVLVPELDVRDDGKQLMIDVDLPGVDEKDVSVTLANGLLTIKGEKRSEREEKKESYYAAERSYGSFERTLRLPEAVDEGRIDARFDRGVLKIVAQKKPEAQKAEKRIEIRKS
jgi:HSP20 family protein